MSRFGRKYDFVKLIVWTLILEVLFSAVFYFGHLYLAKLKNEPYEKAFVAYERPDYFWYFLLIPVLYLLYFANLSWKNRALGQNFSPRLQEILFRVPTLKKSFWRFQLLRFALFFVILGLANPQGAPKKVNIDVTAGEIVVVVDVSRSMLVCDMDMNRSRLQAATNGLSNLAKNLQGTSLSIVVFAGTAYTHMPMTRDLSTASTYISDVSTEMISTQGTQIAEALDLAVVAFSPQVKRKAVYLITDGEDHEGGVDEAIDRVAATGATIHVIAVGTEKGGPIPEKNGGVKRDKNNQIVISKPNFEILKTVAEKTGGVLIKETSAYPNFERIVAQTFVSEQEKIKQESVIRKSHGNAYVLLAIIFLLAYMILLEFNFSKQPERHA